MMAIYHTRRTFGRFLGAALFEMPHRRARAAKLQWEAQPTAQSAYKRRYRADAQIVLLSVPILHRSGVGGGTASWSEAREMRLLEFTGYSLPEHAAGLRRLGFVRELARVAQPESESLYFGVMTASPEESAAEARRALYEQKQTCMYSAIEGRMAPGIVETAGARFTAPSQMSPARYEDLVAMAQQALLSAAPKAPEFDPGAGCERTFLQAVAVLLEDPAPSVETRYVYNGRLYRLRLGKSADPKATAYFRDKRLISQDAKVIRTEGKLHREAGGPETVFHLWVEQGSIRPLPLRIEYQAKPYLRLTFEAE
ncbi:MAG TPA: hypothetical protein VKB88_43050 [Bryobacteraceae bacterium]|nr:hypothetical protein [Bryobacteraceae bacterium]